MAATKHKRWHVRRDDGKIYRNPEEAAHDCKADADLVEACCNGQIPYADCYKFEWYKEDDVPSRKFDHMQEGACYFELSNSGTKDSLARIHLVLGEWVYEAKNIEFYVPVRDYYPMWRAIASQKGWTWEFPSRILCKIMNSNAKFFNAIYGMEISYRHSKETHRDVLAVRFNKPKKELRAMLELQAQLFLQNAFPGGRKPIIDSNGIYYSSIQDASRATGVHSNTIVACCTREKEDVHLPDGKSITFRYIYEPSDAEYHSKEDLLKFWSNLVPKRSEL